MSGSFWVGSTWRIGSDRTASGCGGPDWTGIRLTKNGGVPWKGNGSAVLSLFGRRGEGLIWSRLDQLRTALTSVSLGREGVGWL
jgi:hypothetical protein